MRSKVVCRGVLALVLVAFVASMAMAAPNPKAAASWKRRAQQARSYVTGAPKQFPKAEGAYKAAVDAYVAARGTEATAAEKLAAAYEEGVDAASLREASQAASKAVDGANRAYQAVFARSYAATRERYLNDTLKLKERNLPGYEGGEIDAMVATRTTARDAWAAVADTGARAEASWDEIRDAQTAATNADVDMYHANNRYGYRAEVLRVESYAKRVEDADVAQMLEAYKKMTADTLAADKAFREGQKKVGLMVRERAKAYAAFMTKFNEAQAAKRKK